MYDPEYMQALAKAEGDQIPLSEAYDRSFVPGVDFDPDDPEERELVGMVTEQDRLDSEAAEIQRLRNKNARLLRVLADHGIETEE